MIILSDNINQINADNIYHKLKRLKDSNGLPIEFKNRIHMCNYLNIKNDSTGNARIAEDKYLAEIFNSYKERHKIIITDVYEDYQTRLSNVLCNKIKYKELYDFASRYGNTNISGIYGIYVDKELVYIGSSTSIQTRIRDHCYQMYLENGYNDSKYIELHKYLIEGKTISFEVLDTNITEENRYEVEYQYIEQYKPILNTIGTVKTSNYSKEIINKYQKELLYHHNKINYHQQKVEELQNKIKLVDAQKYLSDKLIKI